eukprot:gnl/Hemi2/24846_TR8356_c0_g1_i1.p2 gnl/Hemi2/24846_TR8356_c0_g1~~gnl/Hemi2/24846_TR8356_c0_g1_i1.p2  ORF type:complete len:381 (-),score=109.58 gnl/Hemi2/24846_TR8356_c0_g1_i1:35-1108(-)
MYNRNPANPQPRRLEDRLHAKLTGTYGNQTGVAAALGQAARPMVQPSVYEQIHAPPPPPPPPHPSEHDRDWKLKRRIETPGKVNADQGNFLARKLRVSTPGKGNEFTEGNNKRRVTTPGKNSDQLNGLPIARKKRAPSPHYETEPPERRHAHEIIIPQQQKAPSSVRINTNEYLDHFIKLNNTGQELLMQRKLRIHTPGGTMRGPSKTSVEVGERPQMRFNKPPDQPLNRIDKQGDMMFPRKRLVVDPGTGFSVGSNTSHRVGEDLPAPPVRTQKHMNPIATARTGEYQEPVGQWKRKLEEPRHTEHDMDTHDRHLGGKTRTRLHMTSESHHFEEPPMYPEGHSRAGFVHPHNRRPF